MDNMLMATLGIATELQDRVDRLEATNAELLEALMEIAKGEGAFSLDQFTFANNTIENMKDIANTAIANAADEVEV